jgi:hypothetical protein
MNDFINAPARPVYDAPAMEGGSNLAVQLARAELDMNIVTARQYPRSYVRAMNNILNLVTMDEESAQECVYALPRGDKPITGPSIRFAEIVASQWGNCHIGSRVVAVDLIDKVVIAEGVFWDLETGMKRVAQVRRRITDKKGKLFNDDMIVVTGNAAASVALREAVLKGVPKAIWRKAFDTARNVIAGDVKTLRVRRDEAVKAFAVYGVKPEMICSVLDVDGIEEIGLDEIATLITMFKDIKSGEAQAETFFPDLAGKPRPSKVSERQMPEPKPADQAKVDPPKTEEKPAPKADPKPVHADTLAQAKPAAQAAQQAETLPLGDVQPKGADKPASGENWVRFYDQVIADALASGPTATKAFHAEKLEAMRQADPAMHEELLGELDQFPEDEGGDE